MIIDLEKLLLQCRTDRARRLAREAVSCYQTGAYRACIVMTWIVVAFDLLDKLRELALSGDANAQARIADFEKYVDNHDVAGALQYEREILDIARREFELFSELEYRDISRLLEDRHKCAHPSMLSAADHYSPTAETASA